MMKWRNCGCFVVKSETMTIMTYNIQAGDGMDGVFNLTRQIEVIKEMKADRCCWDSRSWQFYSKAFCWWSKHNSSRHRNASDICENASISRRRRIWNCDFDKRETKQRSNFPFPQSNTTNNRMWRCTKIRWLLSRSSCCEDSNQKENTSTNTKCLDREHTHIGLYDMQLNEVKQNSSQTSFPHSLMLMLCL